MGNPSTISRKEKRPAAHLRRTKAPEMHGKNSTGDAKSTQIIELDNNQCDDTRHPSPMSVAPNILNDRGAMANRKFQISTGSTVLSTDGTFQNTPFEDVTIAYYNSYATASPAPTRARDLKVYSEDTAIEASATKRQKSGLHQSLNALGSIQTADTGRQDARATTVSTVAACANSPSLRDINSEVYCNPGDINISSATTAPSKPKPLSPPRENKQPVTDSLTVGAKLFGREFGFNYNREEEPLLWNIKSVIDFVDQSHYSRFRTSGLSKVELLETIGYGTIRELPRNRIIWSPQFGYHKQWDKVILESAAGMLGRRISTNKQSLPETYRIVFDSILTLLLTPKRGNPEEMLEVYTTSVYPVVNYALNCLFQNLPDLEVNTGYNKVTASEKTAIHNTILRQLIHRLPELKKLRHTPLPVMPRTESSVYGLSNPPQISGETPLASETFKVPLYLSTAASYGLSFNELGFLYREAVVQLKGTHNFGRIYTAGRQLLDSIEESFYDVLPKRIQHHQKLGGYRTHRTLKPIICRCLGVLFYNLTFEQNLSLWDAYSGFVKLAAAQYQRLSQPEKSLMSLILFSIARKPFKASNQQLGRIYDSSAPEFSDNELLVNQKKIMIFLRERLETLTRLDVIPLCRLDLEPSESPSIRNDLCIISVVSHYLILQTLRMEYPTTDPDETIDYKQIFDAAKQHCSQALLEEIRLVWFRCLSCPVPEGSGLFFMAFISKILNVLPYLSVHVCEVGAQKLVDILLPGKIKTMLTNFNRGRRFLEAQEGAVIELMLTVLTQLAVKIEELVEGPSAIGCGFVGCGICARTHPDLQAS